MKGFRISAPLVAASIAGLCLALNMLGAVPRPLALGLIACLAAGGWLACAPRNTNLTRRVEAFVRGRSFVTLGCLWVLSFVVSACLVGMLRPHYMGFDLAFLTQPVASNLWGDWMRSTIERDMNFLIQHWETAWFSASPLAFFVPAHTAVLLWQALGFVGGAWGAWRVAHLLLRDALFARLSWLLFLTSWIVVNPLFSDAHAPVFGSLLFFPFLFESLVKRQRGKTIFLLILLAQCGEIFFPVIGAYFAFLLVEPARTKSSWVFRGTLAAIVLAGGYALLMFYQRYFGFYFSGDATPSSFLARYHSIGGDSTGILKTILTQPQLILHQLFSVAKVETWLLALLSFGPLPFLALRSKKYRLLSFFILLGIVPYFLKTGLVDDDFKVHRGRHYIAEFGPQWWFLGLIGLQQLLTDTKFLKRKALPVRGRLAKSTVWIAQPQWALPFVAFLIAFHSANWRQSPLFTLRILLSSHYQTPPQVRHYLENIPRNQGIAFFDAEWLCPLGAARRWLLCETLPVAVLEKMPLHVLVLGKEGEAQLKEKLSTVGSLSPKETQLKKFVESDFTQRAQDGWRRVFLEEQASPWKSGNVEYAIWEQAQSPQHTNKP